MHKLVFSLLLFGIIPVHTMFQVTPKLSIFYKRGGNSLYKGDSIEVSLYNVPQEIITDKILPITADHHLYEVGTLIKKCDYHKNTKKNLQPLFENGLPLLRVSQTSKYFCQLLMEEINRRFTLNHVSSNSIFTYFDSQGFYELPILIFKDFESKNGLYFSITLIRQNKIAEKLQMYDKEQYVNLHKLCNTIVNEFDNQTIKNVCENLQKDCVLMNNLSIKDIATLENLLMQGQNYKYVRELDRCISFAKVICPTILQIHIGLNDHDMLKDIKKHMLENKNLLSSFLKCISIPENVSNYLHAHDSFLKTLLPLTVDQTKEEYGCLIFTTDCKGLSNEPTIPVDIICTERLLHH